MLVIENLHISPGIAFYPQCMYRYSPRVPERHPPKVTIPKKPPQRLHPKNDHDATLEMTKKYIRAGTSILIELVTLRTVQAAGGAGLTLSGMSQLSL
jgi:hypothetical protein